jgi:diguanylate cyclase (GGDEF)-like protein/PAS domain S-box-containing protein
MNTYKEIFEHSFDGIYTIDVTPDGRFFCSDANPSFLSFLDITRESLVGSYIDEIENPNHRDILLKKYRACIKANEQIECCTEFHDLPTGYKCFHSILNPLKDENGRIYRIVIIKRDITEQKKRDEQLQMADLALNIISDAVYLINDQLQIHYVNQAACDSLGYTKEELLSKTPFDFDPVLQMDTIHTIRKTLKNDNLIQFETKHQRKDGTVFDVEITTYPYMGDTLSLHIAKDVTAKKQSEKAIKMLTQAVDCSFDSVFLIRSSDSSFLYVNDTAANTLGYSKEELLGGMRVLDIDPDFTAEDLSDHIQKLTQSGRISFQSRHRAKDGRTYPVEVVTNSIGEQYLLSISRDISAEMEANKIIEMLTHAIDASTDTVFLVNPEDASFFYVNETATKTLGYSKEELTGGMGIPDIVPNFDGLLFVRSEFVEKLEKNKDGIRFESVYKTKKGELFPVEVHTQIIYLANKKYALSISHNIADKKTAEEKLKLLASVFTHAREGIVITDRKATIIDANDAYLEISGYSREELIGQNTRIVKSDKHPPSFYESMWQELRANKFWCGEVWNKRKNGELYVERLTISGIYDANGEATHYIGLQTDITTLKDYEYRLERMAFYDSLTGLANRILLFERINHAITISKRLGTMIAVCYLDLDGFKPINDQYGHDIGDELLIEMASRMQKSARESDTVARIGGDEFVMLLFDVKNQRICKEIVEKTLERISHPYKLPDKKSLKLTASIGIMVYPQDESTPDLLLRRADQAMYLAKQNGKNNYVFYK